MAEEVRPNGAGEAAGDGTVAVAETTAADGETRELTIEERLAEAEAQAAEYLDGWQRARAEYANARKRMERQRAEAYADANIEFTKKLLPVLDDFERALGTVPSTIGDDKWFEGLQLVHRKLSTMLQNMNVEAIEAVGQPFDPNFHEALGTEPSAEAESGLVTKVLRRGYKMGERVIRPALVQVAA